MRRKNERTIHLSKPLAVLDLETTGTRVGGDRIVQIGVLKVNPNGRAEPFDSLINPRVRIPPEATRVHRISDRHVKGKPTFRAIAPQLLALLSGCDLAGFNILGFDLPFLNSEFSSASAHFDARKCHVVDVMEIFHRESGGGLSDAYRFYLGKEHAEAHSALADARACWEILQAAVRRQGDLPRTPEELGKFCASLYARYLDSDHWFDGKRDEPVFARGKHHGERVRDVARQDLGYLGWVLQRPDLPKDTRRLVERALKPRWDGVEDVCGK
jgi:DNA polymerase-3 subunit epsilon